MEDSKKLLVFDLDDTLIDTSEVFWQSRTAFINLLSKYGVSEVRTLNVFEEIDSINLGIYGIAPSRYGLTMKEAAIILLEEIGQGSSLDILRYDIEKCASIIINQFPTIMPGTHQLLSWARDRYAISLLTRGAYELQHAKLKELDLLQYFSHVSIVPRKSVDSFLNVLDIMGYRASSALSIGDSIRSDINPALQAGMQCIWIPYTHPHYYWTQEHGDIPIGQHYTAKNLLDLFNILT